MLFERMLRATARVFGSPRNFAAWIVVIVVWGTVLGPAMHFSDTWQLVVNTPTTLVELFAAIAIQHIANEVERKQDEQQRLEMKLTQHIEDMTERIEAQNEAQLRWLGRLHYTLATVVHAQPGAAAEAADSGEAQDRA